MANNEQQGSSPVHASEARKRTPLIIRPDQDASKPRKGAAPKARLNRKHAAKLGMNILGVCILLAAVSVIMARAEGSFGGQTTFPICIGQQLCHESGTSASGSKSPTIRSTPARSLIFVTSTPAATATSITTPTPGLLVPTPTSIYPVLQVNPTSIIIPHYAYCISHKTATVIQLRDVGGQPVIWRVGSGTSSGFNMNVVAGGFLIGPGQAIKVKLTCSSKDVKGHYRLVFQYNGGSVNIPVTVADSRR